MTHGAIDRLRDLYEGASPRAHTFRDVLFIFDITAILYVIVSSFLPANDVTEWVNRVFGVLVLADLMARIAISARPARELIRPLTIAEIVAAISFLWPVGGGTFLRALRTLRLLRTYAFLQRLRGASSWFRRNEDAVVAGTNLFVFIFVMTGVVYDTQHWSNPHIANYADALYFTVTVFTTVGFGDIVPKTEIARVATTLQMLVGILAIGVVAKILLGAVQQAVERRDESPSDAASSAVDEAQAPAADSGRETPPERAADAVPPAAGS